MALHKYKVPPFVFPLSAMSYGLLCLAMSYVTHLMGDSVLQVSSEVIVVVGERRVFPALPSDLCTLWTSGGFENLWDGRRSHPGRVLPWPVLPMGQRHCKFPPSRRKKGFFYLVFWASCCTIGLFGMWAKNKAAAQGWRNCRMLM